MVETLDGVIATVARDNPASVEAYKHGSPQALGYLVGQVMKATNGEANPVEVQARLREYLIDKPNLRKLMTEPSAFDDPAK